MKKIINTCKGVLVRTADFMHIFSNYKELKEYRDDYDKKVVEFNHIEDEFKNRLTQEQLKYNNLSSKYIDKKNKLSVVEQELNESNLKYQEELHEFMDLSFKFDELKEQGVIKDKEIHNFENLIRRLEKKVEFRDIRINELRDIVKDLRKEEIKLRNELKKSKDVIKFLKSKLPKKTLEEIKAYEYSYKEVLKRSKKNDRQD